MTSRLAAFAFTFGAAFLLQVFPLTAQTAEATHQQMGTNCVHIPEGEKRPDYGCFLIGSANNLQFDHPFTYWHLRTFPDRASAEAAKSAHGVVTEEDGKVWLSEFGDKEMELRGGTLVAVVGPLQLLPAKTYDAEVAFAVLPPGGRSAVHIHAGPEAFYVVAGEQCLETPSGARKAGAGQSMSVGPSVPMELNVIGNSVRRSLVVVIHDSTKGFAAASEWKPTGACSK